VKGIDLAIISSGTSSTRQDLQRTGRAIRYQEGKTAVIINIYIKDTQDERWLRARQKKSTNIIHVNSIQEIKDNLAQKEIPTDGVSDPVSKGRYNLFGHH
jgi:superfamily II DNA or RNA helicase